MKRISYLSVLAVVALLSFTGCDDENIIKNEGENKPNEPVLPIEDQNVYQYVDLGLSAKWATFNVGAEKPEDYGGYYAWGETEQKSEYTWQNYKYNNGGDDFWGDVKFSKYLNDNNQTVLEPEDDVAYITGGGNWRMPTGTEMYELVNNCTWTWTTVNGVKGYRITSRVEGFTDQSIFLPAAGSYGLQNEDLSFGRIDSCGKYWSSSLSLVGVSETVSTQAVSIQFASEFVDYCDDYVYDNFRFGGRSVRPVCTSDEWLSHITLSFESDQVLILPDITVLMPLIVKYDGKEYSYSYSEIIWVSENPSVATINKLGTVTPVSYGTTKITASIGNVSAQCIVTVRSESELEHDYVNLGLSVNWATVNVGAVNLWDKGNYFAWGEVETREPSYYWNAVSSDEWYNWNIEKYNYYDDIRVLAPEDDVAHVKWGGSWRMPTREEWRELRENCTWTLTTENGVEGYRVTSNLKGFTDSSIFIPNVASIGLVRGYCNYWSSSLSANVYDAIIFSYSNYLSIDSVYRISGLTVRPVCTSDEWLSAIPNISVILDHDEITMLPGDADVLSVTLSYDGREYSHYGIKWASSNPGVVRVDDCGNVTAISPGTANITATIGTVSGQCSIVVLDESEMDHTFVDLGLSVKWATQNVGTMNYWEKGKIYAWGETYTKDVLYYGYNPYYDFYSGNDDYYECWKYNNFDEIRTLEIEDDVASTWGGDWRMPTKEELEELKDNCTWTWTTVNGVDGYRVTGKKAGYTDSSIFLPAAGGAAYEDLLDGGNYWSNSLAYDNNHEYDIQRAFYLSFGSNKINVGKITRSNGLSVRPVCP